MRIVVPFGFYGSGNIGDEATLHGFAQLLELGGLKAQASVGSRNPPHNRRIEPAFRYFHARARDPRRWWAKVRGTAHAVVGGTPIMDGLGDWPLSELTPLVQAVDRWKVPFAFIGVGIEGLKRDESRRLVREEIAPRTRHWSVRCDRDCARLADYGVPPGDVTVAADMAWLIDPVSSDFGRGELQRWGLSPDRPLIGVNLVNENSQFDRHPPMVAALARSLDELVDRLDGQVIFLSNEVRAEPTFDTAAAGCVVRQMRHANRALVAPGEYFGPRQMMSLVACCALTLSMRYHFCLFSAVQGVPFVAVQRSDKLADLSWDLGWTATVVPPAFTADEIAGHGLRLLADAPTVKASLKQTVARMKSRARKNLVAVTSLLPVGSNTRPVGASAA